jgi:hypothetical protein
LKALVYVEGPSDRSALEVILREIVEEARGRGLGIRFIPPGGSKRRGKDILLREVGLKAAGHLRENENDWIFALPDLHPAERSSMSRYRHTSDHELIDLLRRLFLEEAEKKGLRPEVRKRFRPHCLKYDLEVLLLAAPDALRHYLGTQDRLDRQWRIPVEEQDDDLPARRVVKKLFQKYKDRKSCDGKRGAPRILRRAALDEAVSVCPQRFPPFVRELRALAGGGDLLD